MHGYLGSYIKYGSDPQEEQLKKGMMSGDKGFGEEDSSFSGIIHTQNVHGEVIRKRLMSETGAYHQYYDNVFAAIRCDGELMVHPEEALEAVKIIEAAIMSYQEKRTVSLRDEDIF